MKVKNGENTFEG